MSPSWAHLAEGSRDGAEQGTKHTSLWLWTEDEESGLLFGPIAKYLLTLQSLRKTQTQCLLELEENAISPVRR